MKAYFTALIEHLRPFGDVLQVGFPHLYVASEIQKYSPRSHTILENQPSALEKARKWAEKRPAAHILEENWKSPTASLEKYDAILFTLVEEFPQLEVLEEGRELLQKVSEVFPGLDQMRYTESDLEAFCSMAAGSAQEFLPRFLKELEEKGQVSAEQRTRISRKYKLPLDRVSYLGPEDLFLFFQRCLDLYLRPGGRFACFLRDFSFPPHPGCQQKVVSLKGSKIWIAEKESN